MFFDFENGNAPPLAAHHDIERMLVRIRDRVSACPHTSQESKDSTLKIVEQQLEKLQEVRTSESSA